VLPDWLDVDGMQAAALLAIGACGLGVIAVFLFLQQFLIKAVFVALLAVLGVFAWQYHQNLDTCRVTCSCHFASERIPTPGCPGGAT
jgi:hypothetical protein